MEGHFHEYTWQNSTLSTTYFRLCSLRVVNFWLVIPVFWFLCLWVRDGLWWQEVPILFQLATANLLVVDLDYIGVVRLQDKGVQMSQLIILRKGKRWVITQFLFFFWLGAQRQRPLPY